MHAFDPWRNQFLTSTRPTLSPKSCDHEGFEIFAAGIAVYGNQYTKQAHWHTPMNCFTAKQWIIGTAGLTCGKPITSTSAESRLQTVPTKLRQRYAVRHSPSYSLDSAAVQFIRHRPYITTYWYGLYRRRSFPSEATG